MRLHHFTHRPGATGIFKSGRIEPGIAPAPSGPLRSFGVNLTTDLAPDGHGLPDGRLITQAQAEHLGAFTNSPEGIRCVDHTKYRIAIDIPEEDPALVSFLALYGAQERFVLASDLSAHCPVETEVSDRRLAELLALFKRQPVMKKSSTWWFYRGAAIPVHWVVEVGVKGDGRYWCVPPDEFIAMLAQPSGSAANMR
jgi:hypothetical protein